MGLLARNAVEPTQDVKSSPGREFDRGKSFFQKVQGSTLIKEQREALAPKGMSEVSFLHAKQLLLSVFGVRGRMAEEFAIVQNPHPYLKLMPMRSFSEYDGRLRWINSCIAILVLAAIGLTVFLLEYIYRHQIDDSSFVEVLRLSLSIISLITIFFLWRLMRLQIDLDHYRFGLIGHRGQMFDSPLFYAFLVEVFICLLHTPPFTGYHETEIRSNENLYPFLSPEFNLFVFLRLIFMVRWARDLSPVYRLRNEVLLSGKLQYGIPYFDAKLAIKAFFYGNPFKFIILSCLVLIVVFAYIMHVLERDGQPGKFYYANAIFFVAITMTTVGDGEKMAQTAWGRVMTVVMTIFGVVLASLLITALINALELNYNERISADEAELQTAVTKEMDEAASLIQSTYWLWKKRKEIAASKLPVLEDEERQQVHHRGLTVNNVPTVIVGGGSSSGGGGGARSRRGLATSIRSRANSISVQVTRAVHHYAGKPVIKRNYHLDLEETTLYESFSQCLQNFRAIKFIRLGQDIDAIARNVEANLSVKVDGGVAATEEKTDGNIDQLNDLKSATTNLLTGNKEVIELLTSLQASIARRDILSELMHNEVKDHTEEKTMSVVDDLVFHINKQENVMGKATFMIEEQQKRLERYDDLFFKLAAQVHDLSNSTDLILRALKIETPAKPNATFSSKAGGVSTFSYTDNRSTFKGGPASSGTFASNSLSVAVPPAADVTPPASDVTTVALGKGTSPTVTPPVVALASPTNANTLSASRLAATSPSALRKSSTILAEPLKRKNK